MAKVQASPEIASIKSDEERLRYIQICLQDIINQVNGNLDLLNNLGMKVVTVNFPVANVNTAVSHTLGRAPSGYIPFNKNTNMNVFSGNGGRDSSTISLKSSAIGVASILFF